ncbi:nucleotidyltransferase family protein [Shewanella phaeophyticola]|uniref:Nucleotidyltransferase family protein n=1 Tax=Shewanella phaeophyticola TaxID=2978345 RepID=A0ABT2P936_9GAMM|nr:nucleotidyltransferase family protein [Shewanella sp. KJ10-1]MCT8987248.1 nucleotidyltransferase family protein [Shewanella sp. KJ10-1]MCT8988654.1 nucleotidyltransferase family protein [Shewanella sp. KJ10-1]
MKKHWKDVALAPKQSIRDALEIINFHALQVALVVDDNDQLQGVVTDGDIRRALLNNLTLDQSVALVMNRNPITATFDTPKQKLIRLMEQKSILAIPLIKGGKVVDLQTFKQTLNQPYYDNPVLIMAGGFGTRLRPLTDNCPKPMLKLGNKPLLEMTILNFAKAGFINFYISTHFMPEQIKDYFGDGSRLNVNITYIHEDSPLGTGGALGLLPNDIPDLPLIMMNGDVLTKVDVQRLLEFHNENQAHATMCVREYEYQIPYGVINGNGNTVVSIEEKPTQRFFVNAGIYVVSPEIIKQVSENQVIDMPTLLDNKIQVGGKVLMFPLHEYWLDIGRLNDFNRAQADIYALGMM